MSATGGREWREETGEGLIHTSIVLFRRLPSCTCIGLGTRPPLRVPYTPAPRLAPNPATCTLRHARAAVARTLEKPALSTPRGLGLHPPVRRHIARPRNRQR